MSEFVDSVIHNTVSRKFATNYDEFLRRPQIRMSVLGEAGTNLISIILPNVLLNVFLNSLAFFHFVLVDHQSWNTQACIFSKVF